MGMSVITRKRSMELPLQITFHGVAPLAAVAEGVRARAQGLERFFDSIQSCRVAIEVPHRHHAAGNQYRVRVQVAVPGQELVVTRGGDDKAAYSDVHVALRDAFDAMRRRLESYAEVLRRNP